MLVTKKTESQCAVVFVTSLFVDPYLNGTDWEGDYIEDGMKSSRQQFKTFDGKTLSYDLTDNSWILLSKFNDSLIYTTNGCCDIPDGARSWEYDNITTDAYIQLICSVTTFPSKSPTDNPTFSPTSSPSQQPTAAPSNAPTSKPTESPTDIYQLHPLDPDEVTLPDYSKYNITNYALIAFPMSSTMEYFMNVYTQFPNDSDISYSYTKSIDEVNIDISPVIPDEVGYGLDIAMGTLQIFVGAVTLQNGGISDILGGVDSLLNGALGIATSQANVDPQEAIFEVTKMIYNVVQENNILLTEIQDQISTLGQEIGYQSSYEEVSEYLISITNYWECYTKLINDSAVVPAHCGCNHPFIREECQSDFANELLDINGLTLDHRMVYSGATGSSYWNNFIQTLDLSLLKTFAELSWDYQHTSLDDYEEMDYIYWISNYLQVAYQLGDNLRRSSRMRVWASSVKYGKLARQTHDAFVECSKDILSLSSYIEYFIPYWISSTFRPNFITNKAQCTGGTSCTSTTEINKYPYFYSYIATDDDLFGRYLSSNQDGDIEYRTYHSSKVDDYLRKRITNQDFDNKFYSQTIYDEEIKTLEEHGTILTKTYETMQAYQKYKFSGHQHEYAFIIDLIDPENLPREQIQIQGAESRDASTGKAFFWFLAIFTVLLLQ